MPDATDTSATVPGGDESALLVTALRGLTPVLPMLTGLGERFAAEGHEIALVGGPVRDAFLGRPSPDLDLTTSARPEESETILKAWGDTTWDIGKEFGTIGCRKGDHVVEVTTYRADAYEPDSRKPVVAFGTSLEEDLVRRDFTVNAMALRLPQAQFVDPHGGLQDLAARTLRTPSPPEVSFSDDPLRMMRAARFVSQLDFTVEASALAAMGSMADRIGIVSAERVHDELCKLLVGREPIRGLRVLVDSGLADHVLPELSAMRATKDEHNRHKDVYEHSLTVLQQAIDLETDGPDLLLRLAALLHDIGKPATRRFEPDGGVSFHHHELVGAKMARTRLRALRFDKDTVKTVVKLIELHLRFHGYGEGRWTDSAVRRYVTDAGPVLERLHKLTRADCTTRNVRKAARLKRAYDELEERITRLAAEEELAAVRPELNGNEIAEALGIEPGPVLGEAYKYLLAVRLDDGPVGKEVAREKLLAWWEVRRTSQS